MTTLYRVHAPSGNEERGKAVAVRCCGSARLKLTLSASEFLIRQADGDQCLAPIAVGELITMSVACRWERAEAVTVQSGFCFYSRYSWVGRDSQAMMSRVPASEVDCTPNSNLWLSARVRGTFTKPGWRNGVGPDCEFTLPWGFSIFTSPIDGRHEGQVAEVALVHSKKERDACHCEIVKTCNGVEARRGFPSGFDKLKAAFP